MAFLSCIHGGNRVDSTTRLLIQVLCVPPREVTLGCGQSSVASTPAARATRYTCTATCWGGFASAVIRDLPYVWRENCVWMTTFLVDNLDRGGAAPRRPAHAEPSSHAPFSDSAAACSANRPSKPLISARRLLIFPCSCHHPFAVISSRSLQPSFIRSAHNHWSKTLTN